MTRTTPELAPPLQTSSPHQQEDTILNSDQIIAVNNITASTKINKLPHHTNMRTITTYLKHIRATFRRIFTGICYGRCNLEAQPLSSGYRAPFRFV
ncbi:hypothetical protein AVEN_233665-1 [Araneus ventricosus]|uniref:Uncharacterized protein n=1 Tax=Araneus ventricosus TaxID=182803 RepID=A0A4Y2GLV8_ARAVE|nr:hypothetical protein AVEN_233665-1 [Araneus ventricosus]